MESGSNVILMVVVLILFSPAVVALVDVVDANFLALAIGGK
jgi:hypothetical protein